MTMQPIPELDSAVAKAIGLSSGAIIDGRYFISGAERCLIEHGEDYGHTNIACYPWSPSTDANAALKAADRFFRRGYGQWWQVRRIDDKWQFLAPRIGVDVDGQSLPHAICLAILKAKE